MSGISDRRKLVAEQERRSADRRLLVVFSVCACVRFMVFWTLWVWANLDLSEARPRVGFCAAFGIDLSRLQGACVSCWRLGDCLRRG